MREFIKPAISLFIICMITTLCLATVNSITKDTIAARELSDAQEQRKLVFSDADSFEKLEDEADKDESGLIREVYAAYSEQNLIGYVFNAVPKGYGGEIAVTVGVSNDKKITGVRVGNNSETPGLGSKTANKEFTDQFQEKDISSEIVVVKRSASQDNEIQAVSGATISTNAVTRAVQASAGLAEKLLDGGEQK